MSRRPSFRQMLIIGGTGDLATRHLLPALAGLLAAGDLRDEFALTLAGVESLTTCGCRELAAAALDEANVPAAARQSLVARIGYVQADVREADALKDVMPSDSALVYVALPAHLVPAAVRALQRAGLKRSSRVILDKPFGLDRASAEALNAELPQLLDGPDVFRVDHFLYHDVIQRIVRWRTGSDPLAAFDHLPLLSVEIVWDETRPAGSSGAGYPGVLRDMVQSHLLQLVAVLTMDPPRALRRDDLARRRLDVLQRVSVRQSAELVTDATRARHRLSRDVAAPADDSETYVALSLAVGTPRWEGVPFRLRAAKGVAVSRRSIDVVIERARPSAEPSYVRLGVLDGRVSVGFVGSAPSFEYQLPIAAAGASARLLRAALSGDDTFTLLPEEPEECWRIIEPVMAQWEQAAIPMPEYELGAVVDVAGPHLLTRP
jgi:glucose-6-phosphate 1-dehydrogenase